MSGANHCSSVCWLRRIQFCITAFSAGWLLQNAYSWYISSILRAVVTWALKISSAMASQACCRFATPAKLC
ncbi:hypothetical protein SB00610_05285 [Klebsiella quasipneumoniae subsp. similipneumoniae]|nr:hypothetical protein SB00610_05285 [Klebsiella quasipneumoniae subsp. similipneumoniae]